MSKLQQAVLVWLTFSMATVPAVAARPAAAIEIAVSRCNGQTIDDMSGRLRDYDRHAPRTSQGPLLARYGAIADVLSTLSEEHDILKSVCSSESQTEGLFTQIAALTAWALVLEADVAGQLNASCAAAARGLPTMILADAWLALANRVNDANGVVPSAFNDVIPKIQTRAQAVDLTLPPWSETSQYWRDQLHAKEKAEIATCPSPSPSPTPT
ncbi:MAG TPA: hypothetical protein VGG70_04355 [Candidatus Cybelea sp.]|jgi:hypothetical protein